MSLTQWLGNLGAWSAQVAALVVIAAVAVAGLRVTLPRARLTLWQALLAACLLLPFVQPWLPAPVASMSVLTVQRDSALARDEAPAPIVPAPPERSAFPAGRAAAAVLVLGALARLAWLGLGFARLARLRRAATPIERLPGSIDRAIGLAGASATLALSDGIDGPVTFGLRRPVVLLPKGFLDLTCDFQTTVVCHELAHVRRHDWAWTVGEAFVTAAFWFHPAVWWLVSEIQVSREAVIDREVVEITGARKPYLEALVYLASEGVRPAMAPAVPMLGRRHLARRMRLLLSEVPMSKTRLVVSFATIALTLALAGRYTAWAFPLVGPAPVVEAVAAEQQPPPTKLQPGEQAPRKVHDVRPIYPDAARQAHVEGIVIAEVTIETDGTVSAVGVVRSVPMLDEAAIDAVGQWRFDDVSHRTTMYVTVRFALDDEAKPVAATPATDAPTDAPQATEERPPLPRLIHEVKPRYPRELLGTGTGGVVDLEAVVDMTGAVADVKVVSGPEGFHQAAIDAVKQWRFAPSPTKTTVGIELTFAASKRNQPASLFTPAAPAARLDVVVSRKPKAIHEEKPSFPRALIEKGVAGEVVIEMLVGTDGTVVKARAISGPDELREPALEAAKLWRFEPVDTEVTVQVVFTFTRR